MSGVRSRWLAGVRIAASIFIGMSSTAAQADYWSNVANSGRCWSGCSVSLPAQPSASNDTYPITAPSVVRENYQKFHEVLNSFEGLTPGIEKFMTMREPGSMGDYENRVSWFYETAYREEDKLLQYHDRIREILAKQRKWLERDTAEAALYREQIPALERELGPLDARASSIARERQRWESNVHRVRTAERYWSEQAVEASDDVFTIIQAVAPPAMKRDFFSKTAVRENLRTPPEAAVAAPGWFVQPAGLTAPYANEEPRWYPADRLLPIDQNASISTKIESLKTLALQMRDTATAFDRDFAELKTVRHEGLQAASEREALWGRVESLKASVASRIRDAKEDARRLADEKAAFPMFRDDMMLRALQAWVWTKARDEIVLPKVTQFLTENGFARIAGKLRMEQLAEAAQAAQDINWEKVSHIRGADKFMAVQQKVVALLNPTKSRILQSAQFNALASPAEAKTFSDEVFGELGDDGEELIEAADQVNLPPGYKGLLGKLLRR